MISGEIELTGIDLDDFYTEAELARAYREIDRILPDYQVEKLHQVCLQARKNRLWDKTQAGKIS